MKIAVVGLGYVGLPLSLQFARAGSRSGPRRGRGQVENCNAGRSYIKHIEAADIAEVVKREPSAPPPISAGCEMEAVIICVPTPLNRTASDISYIVGTAETIAPT